MDKKTARKLTELECEYVQLLYAVEQAAREEKLDTYYRLSIQLEETKRNMAILKGERFADIGDDQEAREYINKFTGTRFVNLG